VIGLLAGVLIVRVLYPEVEQVAGEVVVPHAEAYVSVQPTQEGTVRVR
jgi:hypothetical protein